MNIETEIESEVVFFLVKANPMVVLPYREQ